MSQRAVEGFVGDSVEDSVEEVEALCLEEGASCLEEEWTTWLKGFEDENQ